MLGVIVTATIRIWMGSILLLPVLISIFINLKIIKQKVTTLFILVLAFLFSFYLVMQTLNIKSSEDLSNRATQTSNNFAIGGSTIKETASREAQTSNNFAGGGSEVKETASGNTIKGMPDRASDSENYSAKKENAGETKKIKYNNLWDMLLFVPYGMFTVLFRPLPGEVNNIFGFLAGMEDSFLLILFVLAIKRARWQELIEPLSIWAILLIVIWAAAYAFVGFNLGTVCRYRLQILPFFLGLLMYMARNRDSSITFVQTEIVQQFSGEKGIDRESAP
ncbi:MAG: hypothetical protein HY753_01485 [Nitrospirae bacterium]|nr:hypothetical protein [Nitrospirota bacterium]